jgi:5,10-methenyltetrahydrofolate synthetase
VEDEPRLIAPDVGPDFVPAVMPDKAALRRRLLAERRTLGDREERSARLGAALLAWLDAHPATVIGAYWPIRGEFDPLPTLAGWATSGPGRRIGLPVVDPVTKDLAFGAWSPGCPMHDDAYGIPTPTGAEMLDPELLIVACVGFGPGGIRLGYGGGFYDRRLAAPGHRPATVGLCFARGYVSTLAGEAHDIPLDAILTEDGVAWPTKG